MYFFGVVFDDVQFLLDCGCLFGGLLYFGVFLMYRVLGFCCDCGFWLFWTDCF